MGQDMDLGDQIRTIAAAPREDLLTLKKGECFYLAAHRVPVARADSVSTQNCKSDSNRKTSRELVSYRGKIPYTILMDQECVHLAFTDKTWKWEVQYMEEGEVMFKQKVAKWCSSFEAGKEQVKNCNIEASGAPYNSPDSGIAANV
ncbi:hypothetical protein TNCV_4644691 [Trichonephila clavipes]|nr:hypothetical protein TNCV_4644691 [Trichonephila clavipes]